MAIERTNSFHLLLSDDELKLLKLLAEREGLNASDYLRMLIRTMPTSAAQLRLHAAVGSRADLAKLFETYADAFKLAKATPEEPKKKKAK
jgi:hypothetical protein